MKMASASKTKKKNIPRSISEMSQEMLQETLRKKKECNARALQTVEKLCETNVDEEWFLKNLQHINQCHFEDITVERSISKLCGYPLCIQKLEKVPSKQYHISTRYNKVFDITERKNFCSSSCYKAAMHVKNQLFTSPLWFRDQENIPKYVLLKSSKSSLGEEVVFLPDKIQLDEDDVKNKNLQKTVSSKSDKKVVEKCLHSSEDNSNKENNDILNQEINIDDEKCKETVIGHLINEETHEAATNVELENEDVLVKNVSFVKNDKKSETVEKEEKKVERISLNETQGTETDGFTINTNIDITLNVVSENSKLESVNIKSSKESESVSNNTKPEKVERKTTKSETKPKTTGGIFKIETSIFEWFTIDTMLHLYGQEKVKELLSDKTEELKEVLTKPVLLGNSEKIDRMIQLFGLLDTDSFNSSAIKTNLKPLPDYSALKEEGKNLEIKVRAFYKGDLKITEPEKEKKEEEPKTESGPVYLPLVDAHAQQALRRKIVLDKLNRILPELMRIFSTDYILQMAEVRHLVSTFTLTAHNITFKPSEWYLIGIILVKMLSIKDRHLDLILQLESSQKQMVLLLMSFELQHNYLDNLIHRLTDSRNLMQKLSQSTS